MPKITRADVADYLLNPAANGTYVRKTVVLRSSK